MPIHVKAEPKDIAQYVLLPGDPDRAKYIATNFFKNPKLYTDYRKMYGYTGEYKGLTVSVQTSGMGTPSASIVVEELFQLGVQAITRVGTVGGLQKEMQTTDLIIAQSAWSSREIVNQITQCNDFVPCASWALLKAAIDIAQKSTDYKFFVGPVASMNLFYNPNADLYNKKFMELGCLGLEMEAAALFALAAKHNRLASCLLTVSDLIHDPKNFVRASEEKILKGVDHMVEVALDSFLVLSGKAS